jgi:YggT family protein
MLISVRAIVAAVLQFYSFIILAYVLMSWFPITGFVEDIYRVLSSIVEPYIGIFRRIIPSTGMIDFSPMAALIVLWVVQAYVVRYIPF